MAVLFNWSHSEEMTEPGVGPTFFLDPGRTEQEGEAVSRSCLAWDRRKYEMCLSFIVTDSTRCSGSWGWQKHLKYSENSWQNAEASSWLKQKCLISALMPQPWRKKIPDKPLQFRKCWTRNCWVNKVSVSGKEQWNLWFAEVLCIFLHGTAA